MWTGHRKPKAIKGGRTGKGDKVQKAHSLLKEKTLRRSEQKLLRIRPPVAIISKRKNKDIAMSTLRNKVEII